MNRAERRRLDRIVEKVNDPTYYKVTADQMDRLKREITAEAQDRCIKLLFSIPMKVGKEQCEWSDEECACFAEAMCDEYEKVLAGGAMKIDEYARYTEKITGMKFEEVRRK